MTVACCRRRWVSVMLCAIVGSAGCTTKHPAPVATEPPVVQVATPIERDVTDYQIFTARMQAVQSVDVKARVTGYLTKISFKDGDEVTEGDPLFYIDDRPYKATLDRSKADVEYAKASLVKAQADYDFGMRVLKEQKSAISEQDLAKRKGVRDEAAAAVDQAKAVLEKDQLNYDWCKVTAPISGRANRHFIDVGNIVSQDQSTLTNIVSLKPTWAYFDVDENTVLQVQKLIASGKLKSSRTTEIPVQMALADDQGFPIDGAIDFVSNQLDPSTGSIRVRAVFPNEKGNLQAGYFGRVRVPVSEPHKALLVHDQAVGTNQGQRFVLVVNDAKEVEYRPVDVGPLQDGLREVRRYRTIIASGSDGHESSRQVEVLKPTERIIVSGLQRVRPGAKVDPADVQMDTLLRESPKSAPRGK